MSVENMSKHLLEEITLYVKFCVTEEEFSEAMALVERYKDNELALRLFKEYYSTLPEAHEEAVLKISELIHHQGVYLFVVVCTSHSYVYVASAEHILYLAQYQKEITKEVLTFFGYSSQKEFLATCIPVEDLKVYGKDEKGKGEPCRACGVEVGELHLLGCIVEICPWCDGQLSSCNCRFEQLKTEEIESEEQLETFIDMLSEKGRIPYVVNHSPAYPGTSEGLDGEL